MSFIQTYTTSFKSVNDIKYEIPNIQRSVDIDQVNKIYTFQNNFYLKTQKYCLNGSISIAKDLSTNTDYLIDGQHRMNAYSKLSRDFPERKINVMVDTFECLHMNDVELTYEYVNTNNPNPITTLGIDKYKIVKSFRLKMEQQFDKAYFKKSETPVRPNINLEKLEKAIEEKDFIKICNIKSGNDLYELSLKINRYYCSVDAVQYEKWGIKNSSTIIDIINRRSNKLFLGMYTSFEWIDRLHDHIVYQKEFSEMEHKSYSARIRITKNLKKVVWKETNGDKMTGLCYCCKKDIEFDDFECGHIIAVSKGGEHNACNMKPLCSYCNLNMGSMNLEEYKKTLHEQVMIRM